MTHWIYKQLGLCTITGHFRSGRILIRPAARVRAFCNVAEHFASVFARSSQSAREHCSVPTMFRKFLNEKTLSVAQQY